MRAIHRAFTLVWLLACEGTKFADCTPLAETCNGLDDDCDGLADQGLATGYTDVDADGYGSAELGCAGVDVGGDCDDERADVHPYATEVCDDGVDQDCDGAAADCGLQGELLLASEASAVVFEDGVVDSIMAIAPAGDVDGDGVEDAIVGRPNPQRTEYDALDGDPGAAYILRGGEELPAELARAWSSLAPDPASRENAGISVAGAVDLDGDGVDDVAIGASLAASVYIVARPHAGAVALEDVVARIDGSTEGAGQDVRSANDITGDELADLAYSDGATVFVAAGPFAGVATDHDASVTLTQVWDLVADADIDADGYDDLVVGEYAVGEIGDILIFRGPVSGDLSAGDADGTLDNEGDGSRFTATFYNVAGAGDVTGDGVGDLVVGYPGASPAGVAYVVPGAYGISASLADLGLRLDGSSDDGAAGYCVDGVGDVDGDGTDDLVVGDYARGPDNEGAIYLQYGPILGEGVLGDAILAGIADERVGQWCSGVGDITGDGRPDVAIGAAGTWDYALNEVVRPSALYVVPGHGI